MRSIRASAAPLEVRQLGTIGYDEAWQMQRDLVDRRAAGGPDTLLLLEHPSVYTAGRRTEPLDVVNYVRRLEESLIAVCAELGLSAGRVAGRSGVWLPADSARPARKVAAIGVRVQRATTLHGFALNCDCDMAAFGAIVPCGIADAGVTSLSAELSSQVRVDDVRARLADAVCDVLDGHLALASVP